MIRHFLLFIISASFFTAFASDNYFYDFFKKYIPETY